MKKTYEMKVNSLDDININNNLQNQELYHKMIEDPFIPTEVDSYLGVNININIIFFELIIVIK